MEVSRILYWWGTWSKRLLLCSKGTQSITNSWLGKKNLTEHLKNLEENLIVILCLFHLIFKMGLLSVFWNFTFLVIHCNCILRSTSLLSIDNFKSSPSPEIISEALLEISMCPKVSDGSPRAWHKRLYDPTTVLPALSSQALVISPFSSLRNTSHSLYSHCMIFIPWSSTLNIQLNLNHLLHQTPSHPSCGHFWKALPVP